MAASFMVPWKLAAEHGPVSTIVLVMLTAAAVFNTLLFPLSPPS